MSLATTVPAQPGANRARRRSPVSVGIALVVCLLAARPMDPAAAYPGRSPAWTIDTAAGTGSFDFTGDGGPATDAALALPLGVATDDNGDVYIGDTFNNRVRRIDAAGIITTVAGSGAPFEGGFSGDGGPATEALLFYPEGTVVDGHGNLLIADNGNGRIRKVDATTGVITTIVGGGEPADGLGDGGPATEARLNGPQQIDLDSAGNLYIACFNDSRIRKVDAATGIITTVAGGGTPADGLGDGGPATSAQLTNPFDVTVGPDDSLYIGDTFANRVRKVDPTGIITTIAGTGTGGYGGDGGPATAARLNFPSGVEVQGSGNVFITEYNNGTVRRVDAAGIIDTVAGVGTPGFGGDGGYGPEAKLFRPVDVALDAKGRLYIADGDASRVRVLETSFLWIRTDPAIAQAGHSFTYEMTVSGLPATATGVTLTTTLPSQVAFSAATASQGSCGQAAGTVTCDLGTVAVGTAATVRITVNALAPGVIPITATIGADNRASIPVHPTVTSHTRIAHASCGQVISRTTVLAGDIGPCAGDGIRIGSDDVTVDLGGHRVFGFDGPSSGHEAGIRVVGRTKVRIRNGTVSGFDAGVVLDGGGAHTLTGLVVRDNVGPDDVFTAALGDGITLFDSSNNSIHDNEVMGNGVFDGIGVLGEGADGNRIVNNRVTGTIGPADGGAAGQGIIVNGAADNGSPSFISGTRIAHNVVRDNGSAGIANVNDTDAVVEANVVEGNGLRNGAGNGIGVQVGVRTGPSDIRVLVTGNQVHGNGFDGIHVTRNAFGNRIVDNDAADNGRAFGGQGAGSFFFDLTDDNEGCGTNLWKGNTWGSAGFNQICTLVRRNGLPPSSPSAAAAARASGSTAPFARADGLPPSRDINGRRGAPPERLPPTGTERRRPRP